MKTFLKLIIAFAAFGFATANAAFTPEQKAAAIKAVTDAVATGDEEAVKEAVSEQVAAYPELAGDIVAAALKVPGITEPLQKAVVRAAAFTAPGEKAAIIVAINGTDGIGGILRSTLLTLVNSTVDESTNSNGNGNQGSGPPPNPPVPVS